MRNLKSTKWSTWPLEKVALSSKPTATTWDVGTETYICAFGPTDTDSTVSLKRLTSKGEFSDIVSWDAPCPITELACDQILDLHYFEDSQSLMLVFAGGDLVIVHENASAGDNKIEIVGSVDAGVSAASWSPDEELLALATRASTLLYVTRDFDNVADVALSSEDLKASRQVSVGWGKSETQFKGKRAKALRDPTVPEHVDEGLQSSHDIAEATLSWRGDGAFVALSTLSEGRGRVIRVFSRDGTLDSVSEAVDYQEHALSWRPAGNLIASIQRFKDGPRVIFFERNGLRHGEFDLRVRRNGMPNWASSIRLKWNSDSTVLAVIFNDRVQLWTMGNYHYYLKQELPFSDPVADLQWDPEDAMRLAVLTHNSLHSLKFDWSVDRGSSDPPYDLGAIAVIDGQKLKYTCLRIHNIPPPMSWAEIGHFSNITATAVSPKGSQIAILDQLGFSIYSIKLRKRGPAEAQESIRHIFNSRMEYSRQICFSENQVFILRTGINYSTVYQFNLQGQLLENEVKIDEHVSHLFLPLNGRSVVCTQISGSSVSYFDDESLQRSSNSKVPCHLSDPQMQMLNSKVCIYGLSNKGALYANDTQITKKCTGYLITSSHLVFTTPNHLLKFVHLPEKGIERFDVPLDEPEKDERCRSIERGARLVSIMPSAAAITLQMPRGNLETIYPRALVLAGIRKSIDAKRYKEAFLSCRNHRVDMNIIYDHQPKEFLNSVGNFIEQVSRVEHIDLFLSQLREEDVTKTMYKDTFPTGHQTVQDSQKEANLAKSSKVNSICDAFLSALALKTSTNLQNLITADVCKAPPDYESGIRTIRKLKETSPSQVDQAVEHICFLADVNKLYTTALGLYDLEIAHLLAQNSLMDPKEYLPFLQSMEKLPLANRRYALDDYLGNYGKALAHLFTLDDFNTFRDYTSKHNLYLDALQLTKYNRDLYKKILLPYANNLSDTSAFQAAGLIFDSLGLYSEASQNYASARLWRQSLSSALLASETPSKLDSLATSLAESLNESNEYQSAATVYLDHLKDLESAVRALCKGGFYADATRLMTLHSRPEMIQSTLDPALREGLSSMTELLSDCRTQVQKQLSRLREIQGEKATVAAAKANALLNSHTDMDQDAFDPADNTDALSLAASTQISQISTHTSLFTRYTSSSTGSSKSRRKEERKRAMGRRGGPHEERYLVSSLARLAARVESARPEVERLVEGLVGRAMWEEAKGVSGAMREVVEAVGNGVQETWGEGKGGWVADFPAAEGQAGEVRNSGQGEYESIERPKLGGKWEGLHLLGV